jgi:putative endonuclease
MFYVYVIECSFNGKQLFYIGYCRNLKKRLKRHNNGEVRTTKKYDKIKLIYYEACLNKTDAIRREKQLKTGFGRGYIKRRLDSYLTNMRE